MHLWEDWQQDAGAWCSSSCSSSWSCNVSRSLHWAREGCYGNAIQALRGSETTDTRAFEELLSRHSFHPPPSVSIDPKPALVVDKSAVLSCLRAFPERTSPGWSQHLLDAIVGTTAPSSHDCLAALTKFMNFYCQVEPLLVLLHGCVVLWWSQTHCRW